MSGRSSRFEAAFGGPTLAVGRDAIDGHLLRVLHHLLVEGSVSRAARRLNQSQPAVSSALRRLREITGDQLLVRGRGGMTPTERGAALLEPVKLALQQLEVIVTPPAEFEASACRREFNIGSPDYLDARSVGEVLARMQAGAPSAQVNLHSMGASASYAGALESGEMDVVIGNWPNPPDTLRTTALFQDRMVLLMRKTHPLAEQVLDADTYLNASHLAPTPYSVGQRGVVDMYLARERMRRNVVAHVPYFNMAPYLLLGTDMIFTAPARFAEHYASFLPLVIRPVPLDIPPIPYYLLWHDRTHHSAECRWFREQIVAVLRRSGPMH